MIAQLISKSELIVCLGKHMFIKTITHCQRSLSNAITNINNSNKETNNVQLTLKILQGRKTHAAEAEALISNLLNNNSNNSNNSNEKCRSRMLMLIMIEYQE